ncbi:DUF2911 domain-containing protein [Polaribacter cellanae]|uniref:DUF2911 domain-containing protein n=1 Tax=Polaribacter cellanae TaxID=2818493 RepID=A0A975CKX1_9FLAO|nr:DUF2911 domain-containing protein [Polaribacter cellanae]QTE21786.1 DUF2911 domain-containing protein [Polaribacter cellanae]
MKKSIVSLIIFTIALISSNETFAQKFPKLDVSPMDAASYPNNWKDANKLVKVVYSRPQLKGRDLGKLAPKDKVWRTGANEAAEITFYKKVDFGGKKVKPGTYTLFTIPQDGKWTVILSNQKNVWGAYFYDEKEDVLRVTGKVSKSNNKIEAFSILFDGEKDDIKMYMGWGDTIVTVPLEIEKEE